MTTGRFGNTPVFWPDDTSPLREAARLSAQVKQDADFRSDFYKPATLEDCLEQTVQSKNKKDQRSDEDYWYAPGCVPFNFSEDAEDDSRRSTQSSQKSQSSSRGAKEFALDDLKQVTSEVLGVPQHAPGSSLRRTDLGNIHKYAEGLRIGHDIPAKGVKSTNTPEETVRNIVIGQPYFLGQHRSREDKVALLNEAVRVQDGNAIIAVLLFLKQTLKPSLFNQELMQRPRAVSHYLSHLRAVQDNSQLMDVLGMLGRTEDAAMVKYRLAVESPEAVTRLRNLQSCFKSHFQSDPSLEMQAELVKEELKLLEMQLAIEEEDCKVEKEGQNILMQEFPRKAPVVGTSLVTTVYYCCLYHYHVSHNHIASPGQMRVLFNLTEKQFVWTALSALAQIKHWKEIDNLFQGKSWLGKSKMRCCIGFDKAVEILAKAHAPPEVFEKYLQMVDDAEKRFALAKVHKCHSVAIETLVYLRDRQRLLRYKSEIQPQSAAFYDIERILNGSAVKWKN